MARSYIQGIYNPKNKSKYKGNSEQIIFRSSWERRIFLWLDQSPLIVEWSSEELSIPYRSVDEKIHRYFPDIKFTTKSGKSYIAEIKPKKETKVPSKRSKRYLQESVTFVKNNLKWESAIKYCEKNNMKFIILTEDQINPTFSDAKILQKLSELIEF